MTGIRGGLANLLTQLWQWRIPRPMGDAQVILFTSPSLALATKDSDGSISVKKTQGKSVITAFCFIKPTLNGESSSYSKMQNFKIFYLL